MARSYSILASALLPIAFIWLQKAHVGYPRTPTILFWTCHSADIIQHFNSLLCLSIDTTADVSTISHIQAWLYTFNQFWLMRQKGSSSETIFPLNIFNKSWFPPSDFRIPKRSCSKRHQFKVAIVFDQVVQAVKEFCSRSRHNKPNHFLKDLGL